MFLRRAQLLMMLQEYFLVRDKTFRIWPSEILKGLKGRESPNISRDTTRVKYLCRRFLSYAFVCNYLKQRKK